MKRRLPEQGSMLTLMGYKPTVDSSFHNVAITKLVEDEQGNIIEMSHEPVPDDGSDDDGFWCSLMHQAGG